MSLLTDAWLQLYRSQTEAIGAVTCTVAGVTAKAVISELNSDQVFAAGGLSDAGGFSVQMLATDFHTLPQKFDDIVVNGYALQVGNPKLNNGILYLDAVDFTSQET